VFLPVTASSFHRGAVKILRSFGIVAKGEAFPLQAWSGPEGSRFPDFMTTVQDGGKVVSLTHWTPLSPGNIPGTHYC
jgi:hypothetical protein